VPDVYETRLAESWTAGLRGPNRKAYDEFLDDLARRGCEALGYRLTGELIERLCVRHVRGSIRAVVGFVPDADEAWVLLVGEHTRDEANVYQLLYDLTGVEPEEGRSKPPCCDDGLPPEVDPDLVEQLAEHTRHLLKAAERPRQGRGRRRD
jgi:hypothetical protein